MLIVWIIWSAIAALTLWIGILNWRAGKPVGFFSGVKPPAVTDTKKYNHAVATLWFAYALALEVVGLPLLLPGKKAGSLIWCLLGAVAASIALVAGYTVVERRFCRRENSGGDEHEH